MEKELTFILCFFSSVCGAVALTCNASWNGKHATYDIPHHTTAVDSLRSQYSWSDPNGVIATDSSPLDDLVVKKSKDGLVTSSCIPYLTRQLTVHVRNPLTNITEAVDHPATCLLDCDEKLHDSNTTRTPNQPQRPGTKESGVHTPEIAVLVAIAFGSLAGVAALVGVGILIYQYKEEIRKIICRLGGKQQQTVEFSQVPLGDDQVVINM